MKRTIFSLVERGTGVAVLTLLWLLCPNGTVFAQPDKPPVPLPAGPLIQKRMPAMAQWTISTVVTTPSDKADKSGKAETAARTTSESPQPESAKSAKALVVLEQTYTKTQDIVRMEYVDGAKQQWTVWSAQGFQILVPPDGKGCGEVTISLVKDIPNPFQINFTATDFPGFEWISAGNYQDVVEYEKIPCMLFRGKVLSSITEEGKVVYAPVSAYINVETRQPVALQYEQRVILYTYKAPPSVVLALPSNVETLIQSRIKSLKQLTTLPLQPF